MGLGYRPFNATLLVIPQPEKKFTVPYFMAALRGLGTAPSMLQVHVILHPRSPRESWENI